MQIVIRSRGLSRSKCDGIELIMYILLRMCSPMPLNTMFDVTVVGLFIHSCSILQAF